MTARAGIQYRWTVPGPRPLNILQTIGNGSALLDYDGDGNLDVLFVGQRLALYRGDGRWGFRDVSREAGLEGLTGHFLGCAVGDYDNDGHPDIYVSGYRTGLLLHNEHGRFHDVTPDSGIKPQPWGTSCAFGDIDNDGRLDLYVCNYVKFGPDTVPQLCTFNGRQTSCGPLYYKPEFGVLYRNLGNGRYMDITAASGAGNVSGKGLGVAFEPNVRGAPPSILIANDEMPGDMLVPTGGKYVNRGQASGTGYSARGKPQGGMGADWGDYDNDGRFDVSVGTFVDEVKPVYHSEGGGFFEDRSDQLGTSATAAPLVTFGLKWFDCDNDGWLDLILANGDTADNIADYEKGRSYRQPTLLFYNREGRQLEEIGRATGPDFAKSIVGRGLAVGDIDNDGRLDVVVVDSEGAPLLLRNTSTPVGHWLLVKLVGTRCNRDGVGAIVTGSAGGRKVVRHCHTDGSYMSASDSRVHIGLGASTRASVTVRWPGGKLESFGDLVADRVVTLREGTGVLLPGK